MTACKGHEFYFGRYPDFAMLIDLTCCSRTYIIVAVAPFVMLRAFQF